MVHRTFIFFKRKKRKKKKAVITWWHWEAVKVFSILFYTSKIITVKKYAKTQRA
jgi:hypothetical protein